MAAVKEPGRSLMIACMNGTESEEEKAEYKARYMEPEERIYGKAVFEMTPREFIEYNVLRDNMKRGNLGYGDCPKCKNKGYIVGIDEVGNEYQEDCECLQKRRNMEILNHSEYSALLKRCTFERFILKEDWQREVLSRCKDWTKQTRFPLLYLGGKTGAGKTHLAVAAFRIALMRGNHGQFVSWRTMSRDLKMNMTSPDYERKIREMKYVPLLLIDDLFWTVKGGIPSDEDFRLAKEIIDARFYNKRKTIITSNFTPKGMYTLSEEMSGRINEFSGGTKYFSLSFKGEYENYRFNMELLETRESEDIPF